MSARPGGAAGHDALGATEAVWRIESPRLIAGLARITRHVGLAEDLAQDALVAALQRWPRPGVPENPGAWLIATARRRAIDSFRRRATPRRHGRALLRLAEDWTRPELCEDAVRLGRVLAALAPSEPEVHGPVALMEIQASRLRARVGPGGEAGRVSPGPRGSPATPASATCCWRARAARAPAEPPARRTARWAASGSR